MYKQVITKYILPYIHKPVSIKFFTMFPINESHSITSPVSPTSLFLSTYFHSFSPPPSLSLFLSHSLVIYSHCLFLELSCLYQLFQAYVVLGQFLVLKKNRDLFIDWLKDTAGANAKQSGDCHQCLSDWCEEFL